ncbi:aminotransferase class I/II-fold pyridoxal phosphate-dependent enzyme [Candidatus Symbiopectobacterium sp. NZEC151]|uniref:aminotransferase class I/II-fold pyridoxal phosphate-dependent enzyme n=1 Tax=Candidatus Symbiopectobacterium sp. NZEC151 TaxID=2820470 RepID=UPI00222766D7|nr:aminotransferase class I/II-fold pyridoxal phosphate-dependent enzyme [Candidatus Symbiopectobacterium sp. NZEC151]MCW2475163.1 aminotransferase class I/II-fold pyridoxal phosphate-dependent enzyme [Candidatus Symbiopectobacterium sp. NZEC151]
MTTKIDPNWLAGMLTNPTIRGIAMDIAALIREERIAIGSQLPSVRELAEVLGVSPATISAAWSQLRRQKVIAGRGRTGMWVCGQHVSPRPERFEKIGNFGNTILADMTLSAPDPALLPDLSAALCHGLLAPNLNSYQRTAIIPELEQTVRRHWPYPAEAFITSDGGFDGMYLALQALLFPGSSVAVESPTAARVLDMLDHLGMNAIMVECDEHGPEPEALKQALLQKPTAFIFQPRTHSHTGNAISPERLAELAALLAVHDNVLILEDDGVGELSTHPAISLGRYYPDRTVHIRSYSKAYGPDLRLAVISGSKTCMGQIQSFRHFGAGWSSRILQGALAYLLTDAQTQQSIAHAQEVYHQRRQALADALARRGIYVPENDGLCIWLPVPSERYALVTLAARGIAVQPGERAGVKSGQFIRLSICQLPDHLVEPVAEAVSQIFR